MKHIKKHILNIFGILAVLAGTLLFNVGQCFAGQLAFSPMRQYKVLVPGTVDDLSVTISVPSDSDKATEYEIEVRPFYVDDDNITHLEAKENYSLIVDWIELPEDDIQGELKPGERKEINCVINVPEDAPAGGQYAAIVIKTHDDDDDENVGIKQIYEMAHPVFAEVAGETIRKGEINSLELPSIMLSGNITGSASVKNLGNVHSNVKHTLKVFPLFGSEEYFTNEEEPQENVVMPGATRFSSVSWDETPYFGIFRVNYTVEFEGVKNELDKIVIICPLWLLFIVIAIVVLILIKIILGKKQKG